MSEEFVKTETELFDIASRVQEQISAIFAKRQRLLNEDEHCECKKFMEDAVKKFVQIEAILNSN